MKLNLGDIVFIPFPYSDLSAATRRPVVIVGSPNFRGDIICLAVTSKPTQEQAMQLKDNDVQPKLPMESWIRLDKIFTLNQEEIIQHYGQLAPEALTQLPQRLCESLFPNP